MWTINISRNGLHVDVRVNRWQREGRYPVPLAAFELIDCTQESELAMLARAARAVGLELEARRHEEQPELPL